MLNAVTYGNCLETREVRQFGVPFSMRNGLRDVFDVMGRFHKEYIGEIIIYP